MSAACRILVVEDEAKTAQTLELYLTSAGYRVDTAGDGQTALGMCREQVYDLVILDVMLPRLDGLTVCRRLRAESAVWILLLTARVTESDRIEGLELGADDYVCKPFSPREVVARVQALLRRGRGVQGSTASDSESAETKLTWGDLEVEVDQRQARLRHQTLPLTASEFQLLVVFLRSPGRVFTRAQLADSALGRDFEGQDRTIDAHVRNLRRKLKHVDPAFEPINTVFGVGYRLADEGSA